MITRITVSPTAIDTRSVTLQKKLADFPFAKEITDIDLSDVYTIDKMLSKGNLVRIADMLTNPVTQESTIWQLSTSGKPFRFTKAEQVGSFVTGTFTWAIEIGFLPGVTDNIATTTKEAIADLLNVQFSRHEGVYSSQVIFITGALSEAQTWQIANSLYNPLIQRAYIKSSDQYKKDIGMDFVVPKVVITAEATVGEVDLAVDDETLAAIGKHGIQNPDGTRRGPLALDLPYMQAIQRYFKKQKRNPTDIELESLAQTWSEHCKHTIFRDTLDEIKEGIFKRYIKRATDEIRKKKGMADFCISVFTDNSGGIAFDDDYIVTHKVETHNSPSALDPFGGAVTGIVGVNRDTLGFGLGAKPVANYYGYCFADPFVDRPLYRGPNKTQKMLSSKRIMDGVIAGVNNGGNCSGIPTPQGFIFFDERFRGKPLVFVGTIGLIPKTVAGQPSHMKQARPGDYVVMLGGRVGKDGIHGATFSSEAMHAGSPATAVQIGDPITQKKFSDAIVNEARDKYLYNSITDNGAGGLSCSVAEMAKESGGCAVALEKVPLKYPGLEPWEIWISESQERMTLAVPPKKWPTFRKLMQRHDVEATVIGTFTNSGKCIVTYKTEKIMDIDLAFLHNGLPKRQLTSRYKKQSRIEPKIPPPQKLTTALKHMLSRINIASYEFISQQYDHIVQGNAVHMPLQGKGRINADTSAIRPVLASNKAVVLSQGIYPTYGDISTYHMAQAALDTAVRNVIAAGASPNQIAVLDNFCWCSATEPARLWQLKEAARAIYELALTYETPFISGKDSMFNDFHGFDAQGKPIVLSIPPTVLITSMGITEDYTKLISLDAKMTGDVVYLLGRTHDELGASEYYAMVSETTKQKDCIGTVVPKVDADKNWQMYKAYYQCVDERLLASAQSVGRGGLGVALAKTAMGGKRGLDISLRGISTTVTRDDTALFSESQGRILVTVAIKNSDRFETLMKNHPYTKLGEVTEKPQLIIRGATNKPVISLPIMDALQAYRATFAGF